MRMDVKAVIEEQRVPSLHASCFVQELLVSRCQIFNYENRSFEIVCAESDIPKREQRCEQIMQGSGTYVM